VQNWYEIPQAPQKQNTSKADYMNPSTSATYVEQSALNTNTEVRQSSSSSGKIFIILTSTLETSGHKMWSNF